MALLYALELDATLESEDLTVIQPHVLLPVAHRLARQRSVSLKAIQDEPMILLDLPHSRDYFQQLFQHLGISPRIDHRTASFELVRGLVARGHGYSVLNLQPASELTYDGSRVRCLPIREKAMPLRVVLARLRNSRWTRRSEAFATSCRAFFSDS
jgi:DNA-binding transcriptional LysR family regulator